MSNEATDEQRCIKDAFDTYPGLLLICAGVGTGKTSTLCYIAMVLRRASQLWEKRIDVRDPI
jgi:Tfp pilus assembly pilus retraction ATPase PilT